MQDHETPVLGYKYGDMTDTANFHSLEFRVTGKNEDIKSNHVEPGA